jgi:hypothetical protein
MEIVNYLEELNGIISGYKNLKILGTAYKAKYDLVIGSSKGCFAIVTNNGEDAEEWAHAFAQIEEAQGMQIEWSNDKFAVVKLKLTLEQKLRMIHEELRDIADAFEMKLSNTPDYFALQLAAEDSTHFELLEAIIPVMFGNVRVINCYKKHIHIFIHCKD